MSQNYPEPVIPTAQEAVLARAASHALEQHAGEALRVQLAGSDHAPTILDLPPIVAQLLVNILKETAAGNAVTLVPLKAEITPHQAAELLNVSRPYVVGLIDKGVLAARLVGTHRRLLLAEVLAYKAETFARRSEVLRELVAHDQQLGLI